MSLTLYFLRHGQSALNRGDILCGCGVDPDLTSGGVQMAREFGDAYRAFPFQAIFCSPLRRTRATALPISELSGLAPEIREDLKEIDYGKWEGLGREEVLRKYHDDYLRWEADPAWHPPTGGETAIVLAGRALRVRVRVHEPAVGIEQHDSFAERLHHRLAERRDGEEGGQRRGLISRSHMRQ